MGLLRVIGPVIFNLILVFALSTSIIVFPSRQMTKPLNIPFFRFDQMHGPIREDLLTAATRVVDSGFYILGPEVQTFENAFARYCGVQHAIGVANGLEALHLALKTLGIGPGDEVIVPSNTYIATVLAVSYTGATPVLVEPHMDTANIDPGGIEAMITPSTKAIIPVHLYGQSCEMHTIMDMANRHHLFVIEDNAQSQGASCKGKRTGSWGHVNGTSFYPGKNIGALGDGGAITTDDSDLAADIRKWRNYGSSVKYYNEIKGYNCRLDELQAAMLQVKLNKLDQWNDERRRLANRYDQALSGVGDIQTIRLAAECTSVYHLYPVRTSLRDKLQTVLSAKGIGTLIHYPVPPHLQAAYRGHGWKEGQFPIAEQHAKTLLSLPLFPGLTDSEQDYIVETIQSFFL